MKNGRKHQERDLRRLLQERLEDPSAWMSESYFTEMDGIIATVYKDRMRGLSKKSELLNSTTKVSESPAMVGFEEFSEYCWGLLEVGYDRDPWSAEGDSRKREPLLPKLRERLPAWLSQENDCSLRAFLKTIFSRELQQRIYRQSGSNVRTRFKQVEAVLPEIAEKRVVPGRQKQTVWYLPGYREADPVTFDQLLDAARKAEAPKPDYSRSGGRGPSISKNEMRGFLQRLFSEVAAPVKQSDLRDMLVEHYSLQGVSFVSIDHPGDQLSGNGSGDDKSERRDFQLADSRASDLFPAAEYHEAATSLIDDFDEPLRRYFLGIFVDELSQSEVAARLGVSNATVSGLKKRLQVLVSGLQQEGFDEDEIRSVITLVGERLDEMRRVGRLVERER